MNIEQGKVKFQKLTAENLPEPNKLIWIKRKTGSIYFGYREDKPIATNEDASRDCCGALFIMETGQKYYLGDGENYFVYRTDKYNEETLRADLFDKDGNIIAKTLVKGGMLMANKTHHQVINEFEVAVM